MTADEFASKNNQESCESVTDFAENYLNFLSQYSTLDVSESSVIRIESKSYVLGTPQIVVTLESYLEKHSLTDL